MLALVIWLGVGIMSAGASLLGSSEVITPHSNQEQISTSHEISPSQDPAKELLPLTGRSFTTRPASDLQLIAQNYASRTVPGGSVEEDSVNTGQSKHAPHNAKAAKHNAKVGSTISGKQFRRLAPGIGAEVPQVKPDSGQIQREQDEDRPIEGHWRI